MLHCVFGGGDVVYGDVGNIHLVVVFTAGDDGGDFGESFENGGLDPVEGDQTDDVVVKEKPDKAVNRGRSLCGDHQ